MRNSDEIVKLIPPEALRFCAKSLGPESPAAEAWNLWRAVQARGGEPICVTVNGEGSPLYVLDVRELIREAASA